MKKQISFVTYNIQFSQHSNEVINNLLEMVASGVSMICLQEVVIYEKENIIKNLLHKLGDSWQAECHLGEEKNIFGMGNCILWNKTVLSIKSKHLFFLPYSQQLKIHEKIFSFLAGGIVSSLKRRMILIKFGIGKKSLYVANVHLDHNGGMRHRLKQLLYIKHLSKQINIPAGEIICGDFNCLDLLKTGKEQKLYKELFGSHYIEATKQIDWTADLFNIDTSLGVAVLGKIIRLLNIHVRRKIDFVWLKNIKLKNCQKLDLYGSDHMPITTTVEF